MVRFQWHVEEDLGAYISPNRMQVVKETGVSHALCEIELAGQSICLEAILSLPPNYMQEGAIKDVGVVLAHGSQAATWKGKTLTAIASKLAAEGYLVMRYNCGGKEQRRLRILEKTVDTAICCPFARNVTRWVLAGIGSGARVAASVGGKCRGNLVGYALLGYPMMEPVSVFKGPTAPDSTGPLTKLHAPLLFVQPGKDKWGNAGILREVANILPSWDVRMVDVEGVDGAFRDPDVGGHPTNEMRAKLADTVLEFVSAINNHTLATNTSLPRIKAAPYPTVIPVPGLRQPMDQPMFHLVTRQAAQLLPPGAKPGVQPAHAVLTGAAPTTVVLGVNAAAVSAAAAAAAAKSGAPGTAAPSAPAQPPPAGAGASVPTAGIAVTAAADAGLGMSGTEHVQTQPALGPQAPQLAAPLELNHASGAVGAAVGSAEGGAEAGPQVFSLSPATAVRRSGAGVSGAAPAQSLDAPAMGLMAEALQAAGAVPSGEAAAGDEEPSARKPRLEGLDLSTEQPPADALMGGAGAGMAALPGVGVLSEVQAAHMLGAAGQGADVAAMQQPLVEDTHMADA